MPKDMDDHACDEVVETVNTHAKKLMWRLYRTRGHHLIEINIQRERLTTNILISPTSLELGQIASQLQWAMQAERAEVYGIVTEAYLEANAAVVAAGADADAALSVRDVLRELQQRIEARGVVRWPWAWGDDADAVENATSEVSLAVPTPDDDDPSVMGAGTSQPMPPPPDPPAPTTKTAKKKR